MALVIDQNIIILFILLVLSAFFSGSETALMALDKAQVRQMVKQKKRGALAVERLRKTPHRLLTTILVGNNFVNIGASALATIVAIEYFGNAGPGIAVGILTFLILIFGEIIPKSFAATHKKIFARMVAPIVETLAFVLKPLLFVLELITKLAFRIMGMKLKEEEKVTEDELVTLLGMSAEQGQILPQEKKMVEQIFELNDVPVREIMTPRTEIHGIEASKKLSDVKKIILQTPYSRIPVYDKQPDNVIGILHMKMALQNILRGRLNQKVRGMLIPVLFVPETKKCDVLLNEFQKKHVHMAMVIGEHGEVRGLVTLEDLLEEIVGEIVDETDKFSENMVRLNKNTMLVQGETELDEVNENIGTTLEDKIFHTLGGYMMDQFDKVPSPGDKLEVDGKIFLVSKMSGKRITEVKVIT